MLTCIADVATLVRSKNAGPFWLTFDIMFASDDVYEKARDSGVFDRSGLAQLFGQSEEDVMVFFHDPARAIKLSLPRPQSSGSETDSDVFGGQQYAPLLNLEFDM